MPTIDVDYAEFEKLLGMKLNSDMEKADAVLAYVKGEVKAFDKQQGVMNIEIKDTNRPDIWNVEGLTRALRGFLGLEDGIRRYSLGKAIIEAYVHPGLKNIRPFIGCSVVQNLHLTDTMIRGFMHLQDKLDQSYGRNRQRSSIGLYNFDLIKSPLKYSVTDPESVKFVPLGYDKIMSLAQILREHPKGLEYGHIVKKHALYPVLLDADDKPLSFPPIINSNDLGRITEDTNSVLVEVTGTAHDTVSNVLKIVTLSLMDRGGRALSAIVHYPKEKLPELTPNLDSSSICLSVDYVNEICGLQLTAKQITKLLSKAGYGVDKTHLPENLIVQVPCYRIDIMHPIDIVEDIAIAFDFNEIKPLWRRLPTTGAMRPKQNVLDMTRELMIGLGYQEILTYTLTNKDSLFAKMNVKKQSIIELENPKVQTMTCLRNWLLPSLMEFLSCNLSVEYPQRVFEQGKVTQPDSKNETRTRDEERVAAVTTHSNASFSEIKSVLSAFLGNLNVKWHLVPTSHGSFIEGRVGAIIVDAEEIGYVGELSPIVLTAWKLENPAAAFELTIER